LYLEVAAVSARQYHMGPTRYKQLHMLLVVKVRLAKQP
jgi:hypothetical protein